jgi:hypothetical protein
MFLFFDIIHKSIERKFLSVFGGYRCVSVNEFPSYRKEKKRGGILGPLFKSPKGSYTSVKDLTPTLSRCKILLTLEE